MAFVTAQDAIRLDSMVRVSDADNENALLEALADILASGAKSLMILACSSNDYSSPTLNNFLRDSPVPVCGGLFPEVFCASCRLDRGFVVVGFPFSISVSCYQQISSFHTNKTRIADGDLNGLSQDLLVFIDAASSAAEDFICGLYEEIGGGIDVVGGGCGSLDFKSRPCVFSRAGLLADAALVVQLPVPMECAAGHGWQVLSGPYLVTEADGVHVKTINYLPAYQVYKNLLEEITEYRFSDNNFFEISQNFPLGIVGLNKDILVRDPVQSVNGELICVGRIPVNSMIYILCAKPENIIQAAEKTASKLANKGERGVAGVELVLAFDCVSRALYLGDNFAGELAAIQHGLGSDKSLVGALSIGEIANVSQGTISLLNKSIVLGKL